MESVGKVVADNARLRSDAIALRENLEARPCAVLALALEANLKVVHLGLSTCHAMSGREDKSTGIFRITLHFEV